MLCPLHKLFPRIKAWSSPENNPSGCGNNLHGETVVRVIIIIHRPNNNFTGSVRPKPRNNVECFAANNHGLSTENHQIFAAHRSHSPNTTSIAPMIAVTSGSMWPTLMKSIAWRWLNAVGRILQRYGLFEPSEIR